MKKYFVVQTVLDDQSVKDFVDFQIHKEYKIYFQFFYYMRLLSTLLLVSSLTIGLYRQGIAIENLYVAISFGSLFFLLLSILAPRIKVRRMQEKLLIRHRENILTCYEDQLQDDRGCIRRRIFLRHMQSEGYSMKS